MSATVDDRLCHVPLELNQTRELGTGLKVMEARAEGEDSEEIEVCGLPLVAREAKDLDTGEPMEFWRCPMCDRRVGEPEPI